MTIAAPRALAKKAGARPVKAPAKKTEAARNKALAAFRKIGSWVRTRMDSIDEGDLIATETGTYCVVRKEISGRRGSQLSVRHVETGSIRSMRFDPRAWLMRVRLPEVADIRGITWRLAQGDVVIYPGEEPQDGIVAIRHTRSWFRSAAPWTPLSDGEVILAVKEGRAYILRCSTISGDAPAPRRFAPGTVVATAHRAAKEPSVWILNAPNEWVGNARGVTMSNAMIRHELSRGTYRVLRVPEIEK